MITILFIIALLVSRVCIAAALSVCTKQRDESSGANLRLRTVQTPACGLELTLLRPTMDRETVARPVGPQDAPLGGPWVAARGLQDAADSPQDVVLSGTNNEQAKESLESLDRLISRNLILFVVRIRDALRLGDPCWKRWSKTSATGTGVVVAGWAGTITTGQNRGAIEAFREWLAVHRTSVIMRGREDVSQALVGDLRHQSAAPVEGTTLGSLPRPDGGPAYFGGREDAVYLRGWDDAVEAMCRGNQANGPRWGSAAYMTGWNHAVRASARRAVASDPLPSRSTRLRQPAGATSVPPTPQNPSMQSAR